MSLQIKQGANPFCLSKQFSYDIKPFFPYGLCIKTQIVYNWHSSLDTRESIIYIYIYIYIHIYIYTSLHVDAAP